MDHMVTTVAAGPRRLALQRAPLLLFLFGIALNQTSVIFGLNLSIADVFAVVILVLTAMTSRLFFPTGPTIYFFALSLLVLIMGGFITPNVIPIDQTYTDVLADYLKLATSFCYFLLGVNIVRAGQARNVLRAFALTAAFIGVLAVAQTAIPAVPTIEFMLYGEIRFRGLMNDPNYFSVIQLAALAVMWHDKEIARRLRYPALVFLAASVLTSGSKTGTLTLLIFMLWRVVLAIFTRQRSGQGFSGYRILLAVAVPAGLLGLILLLANRALRLSVAASLDQVPALSRLGPLLVDFGSGIELDGSARDDAWLNAIRILEIFPFTGIGAGTYEEVAMELTGSPVLAHNTFLQIAAEWGLIFAAIIGVWILVLLLRRPRPGTSLRLWATTRDALLVIMIGSLGISLQNSRLLWLIVGMLLAVHIFETVRRPVLNQEFHYVKKP